MEKCTLKFRVESLVMFSFLGLALLGQSVWSYAPNGHRLEARKVENGPLVDGYLKDEVWQQAEPFTDFKMVKPDTGVEPTEKTELRVLYDNKNLYIGVYCFTKDPSTITVTDLQADRGRGNGNDLVRILLDPFQDKRNAYVFLVNPKGTRTDGLATGERFSTNWDGIWEAKTKYLQDGWSIEIKIPFKTISFNPRLGEWGFNVERFLARKSEVIRLNGISKDSFFYNPAEAALLRGFKGIKQGKGITFKPYAALDVSRDYENNEKREWKLNGGFDLYKNFTPNLVGVFTVNTDFAETEVDDRQINLSRFSLYYPEKRAFFLEGSEIFAFEGGGGHRPSFVPFFSRNIGLYDEEQVPINWGAKVYGKIGNTNLALLNVKTRKTNGLAAQNFIAGRIYQNVLSESKIGIVFTSGEPGAATGSVNRLLGIDFKYATSRFMKNKNFTLSGWWVTNKNEITDGKHYGYGFKADYPNDLFDIAVTYNYFGDALEPGLGYLPRNSVQKLNGFFQYRPRPKNGLIGKIIRQFFFRVFSNFYWDLEGNLETARNSFGLLNFRTESGDMFEFYLIAQEEVLDEPFEVSDGVEIPIDAFSFTRYQFEFRSAAHRIVKVNAEYEFGGFYSGELTKTKLGLDFNHKGNIKLGLQGIFIRGDLPEGKFNENLFRAKADFYLNPDLGLMTFIQYDSVSENIGANIRFKWRISPGNTIYLVYNKSWERGWDPENLSRFVGLEDRGIFKVQLSVRP